MQYIRGTDELWPTNESVTTWLVNLSHRINEQQIRKKVSKRMEIMTAQRCRHWSLRRRASRQCYRSSSTCSICFGFVVQQAVVTTLLTRSDGTWRRSSTLVRSRNTTSRVSEHQLSMKNPIPVDLIFCSPFLKTFIDESWTMWSGKLKW